MTNFKEMDTAERKDYANYLWSRLRVVIGVPGMFNRVLVEHFDAEREVYGLDKEIKQHLEKD